MSTEEESQQPIPQLVEDWVHTNPFPILVLGEDSKTLSSNEALESLLEQIKMDRGNLVRQLLSTADNTVAPQEDLLAILEDTQCVVKRVSLTGSHHYVSHIVKLTIDGEGCLCCILMPDSDPSQTYLTGVLNTITTLVVEYDSKGNIRYLNDQLLSHLGYTAEDRPALRHMKQLEPTFLEDENKRRIERVEKYGVSRFHTKFVSKKGTLLTVDASLVKNPIPGDSCYLFTATDVTLQLVHHNKLRTALAESNKEGKALQRENSRLRVEVERILGQQRMVYESSASGKVMDRIQQIAPTDVPVLISGEPGTGKKLIAQTIHRMSRRQDQAFELVDCALLPPELIESELFGYEPGVFTGAYRDRVGRLAAADGGTLYLHQISELPLLTQGKILSVLQEGRFVPVGQTAPRPTNIRLVADTDQDLKSLVEEGKFREDLYFRINTFRIDSLPLRKRREDIARLIEHFTLRYNTKYSKEMSGPDPTTLARLKLYDFPGNVSELENMVERAFLVADDQDLRLTLSAGVRNEAKPVLN
ncbi:MAG: sigma 54-interacting transcriptional regulator, partial [Lewinella sp.]